MRSESSCEYLCFWVEARQELTTNSGEKDFERFGWGIRVRSDNDVNFFVVWKDVEGGTASDGYIDRFDGRLGLESNFQSIVEPFEGEVT